MANGALKLSRQQHLYFGPSIAPAILFCTDKCAQSYVLQLGGRVSERPELVVEGQEGFDCGPERGGGQQA